MKLHWSPRSPFVRKVMIAAHELGLAERFSTVRTVVHPEVPHEGLMADNPLSKLPTLVLDDGSALFDSRVICEYFDGLAGGARLFPAAGSERLAALRDQAMGDGLMDIALLWLMERYEPEERRSPKLIAAFQTKVARTLDRLDADIGAIAARPYDIGHLTIGPARMNMLNGLVMFWLEAAGAAPDTVTHVVHTHLHSDHVGWNTSYVDGR